MPYQRMYARGDTFDPNFIPLMTPADSAALTTSTASPTSTSTPTQVTNPISNIRHNTPVLLCIVIGAVIVAATLSVGLAWVLRLVCCSSERRDRRKRKLDRSTWGPSAVAADDHPNDSNDSARNSLDSVTVKGDDEDAKIDALFGDTTLNSHHGGAVPVLSYADTYRAQEASKSTWNGKGWTLFDPPVACIQPPEPVVVNSAMPVTGGGNYGAARQDLADRDVGGFTWPSSVERQPSFIERLVQRHHQHSELPTTAPLPYPFQAKASQPASRMASLGGAANRAVMNMLPVNLRNAATTASRQRATKKRYNDMQPYLDSDFEGTIGGKDRELPMARRLRRERFSVDWTTEEESWSPLANAPKHLGRRDDSHPRIQPRVESMVMAAPLLHVGRGKTQADFTPGLAGVGAAWSRRSSHPSSLIVKSSVAVPQLPKIIEPNRSSVLPFPVLEGDRRGRLLGSVGRWLGQVTEAGETADPYTALSPRPDRRLTKNGSLRSDYTSTTLADSNSDTQVDSYTHTSASGKAERLLQRVDAQQIEHDRQQRRLLRKARMFEPRTNDAVPQQQLGSTEVAADVSRAPSIRPHFFATTDLENWLEPGKISTSHGFKVLEEQDAASSVSADPFASDIETKQTAGVGKPKLRSSSSKQRLLSSSIASPRGTVKDTGRKKREALRPVNTSSSIKARGNSYGAIASACQSSAAITTISSVFDEAFTAQLNKLANSKSTSTAEVAAKQRSRKSQSSEEAKARAKAEADAAVRDAWRRRKMLSISSRGSQRSRTTKTTVASTGQTEVADKQLSRQESVRSQQSIYSELTAMSEYQFQAPLLSDSARGTMLTSCGQSTVDLESEEEAIVVAQAATEARKQEEEASLKKQLKKEAKREHKRAERQRAKETAAAAASELSTKASEPLPVPDTGSHPLPRHTKEPRQVTADTALSLQHLSNTASQQQQLEVRRTIKKQRSISLGLARMADVDAMNAVTIPDSPWTSSDSDISIRRWGEPRRQDSLRFQAQATPISASRRATERATKHARANSYYYGMGADGNPRDFC